MKKVIFVAIAIFALTSCSKSRTCSCTGKSSLENTDISYVNEVIGTPKKAKASCEAQSYENSVATVECKLK